MKRLWRLIVIIAAMIFIVVLGVRNPVLISSGTLDSDDKRLSTQSIRQHINTLVSGNHHRYYADPQGLNAAASYIADIFNQSCPQSETQVFVANNEEYKNLKCLFKGESRERIVIGAHYDVHGPLPGADDNASGVAVILRLAQLLEGSTDLPHDVEIVAFSLEEPPFFATPHMGSVHHAEALKEQDVSLKYMVSVEMVGYFSEKPDSQSYPSDLLKLIYPDQGNFIALIGGLKEYLPIRHLKAKLQQGMSLPVYSLNAVEALKGIDYSDHRSYWKLGYEAYMITDTSFYRNPNYHKASDTIETLDFEKMAELSHGLLNLVQSP